MFQLSLVLVTLSIITIHIQKTTGAPPIRISTCAELQDIPIQPKADYVLVNNINCHGFDFHPINITFDGRLDGQGYVIKDLFINNSAVGGLFYFLYDAVVTNLTLDQPIVGGPIYYLGGLSGNCYNSTISHVSLRGGSVTSNQSLCTGGLIGSITQCRLINCSTDTIVTAYPGTFSGTAGGMIGCLVTSNLTNCSSHSTVTGSTAGGLIGGSFGGSSGGSPSFYNNLTFCSATGYVRNPFSSSGEAGGLVGASYSGINFNSCYSTSLVDGYTGYAGGLIGTLTSGYVNDTYATGQTLGTKQCGGLVGRMDVTWTSGWWISNSYAVGSVCSSLTSGGFTGKPEPAHEDFLYNTNYWDIETTGFKESWGGGTGKTTSEMYEKATYVNWNFITIWNITEGKSYPWLY